MCFWICSPHFLAHLDPLKNYDLCTVHSQPGKRHRPLASIILTLPCMLSELPQLWGVTLLTSVLWCSVVSISIVFSSCPLGLMVSPGFQTKSFQGESC